MQLDLFAAQDAADAAERAGRTTAERIAAGGVEVIDTATLAKLCREQAEALEERDRDDQVRLGLTRPSFHDEARRLRELAEWLDERTAQDEAQHDAQHEGPGGTVPRERVGWPCPRCDAEPGRMCGASSIDGRAFLHCGRGFLIGFTSPGAGESSRDTIEAGANPAARCSRATTSPRSCPASTTPTTSGCSWPCSPCAAAASPRSRATHRHRVGPNPATTR